MDFEGVLKQIIYENTQTGYRIISVDTDDGAVVVTGQMPPLRLSEKIRIEGDMIYHPQYGEQVRAQTVESLGFDSEEAVKAYLVTLPTIGDKTADLIVEHFGTQTQEILKNQVDRLEEIRGIGPKSLEKIKIKLAQDGENAENFIYLQGLGLSRQQAVQILELYGDDTKETIRENPYRLITEIRGIGFVIADRVALKGGYQRDSLFRIEAAIRYYLREEENKNGHCYVYEEKMIEDVARLLDLGTLTVQEALAELDSSGLLWEKTADEKGRQIVYDRDLFLAESHAAACMRDLLKTPGRVKVLSADQAIANLSFELGEEQKKAIEKAIREKVLVITGGPGTGKTTIISTIVQAYEAAGARVALAAPTGRAAKRMSQSCRKEAVTLHRLLGYMPLEGQYFSKNEDDPVEADIVIVDEASMMDIYLFDALVSALDSRTRLVLVGDVDQLPSVGPGQVLKDLIMSEAVSVVVLDRIYRQAQESHICLNAHRINRGLGPMLNDKNKDFFFIDAETAEETQKKILSLMSHRLPNHYDFCSAQAMVVLTPIKKSINGQHIINALLQDVLNPKKPMLEELTVGQKIFREGDKVMQIKNNYKKEVMRPNGEKEMGVYNGDLGTVTRVDPIEESITVIFDDDSLVDYEKVELGELELAYAMTIHKSQGSEFPVVIIPIVPAPWMLMTRNLLYTAITRAKKLVVLVGRRDILKKMIANNYVHNRNTLLKKRIDEAMRDEMD